MPIGKKKHTKQIEPRVNKKNSYQELIWDKALQSKYKPLIAVEIENSAMVAEGREVFKMYHNASASQIKGDFFRMEKNYPQALSRGFAAVDKACSEGSQYGLFLHKNGKMIKKPVSIYTCEDISKWKKDPINIELFIFKSNSTQIKVKVPKDFYIQTEIGVLEASVKGKEKSFFKGYAVAHPKEAVFLMSDRTKYKDTSRDYSFIIMNNLGHQLFHLERKHVHRENQKKKLGYVNVDGSRVRRDHFVIPVFYDRSPEDEKYIKHFEVNLIDSITGKTFYKETIPAKKFLVFDKWNPTMPKRVKHKVPLDSINLPKQKTSIYAEAVVRTLNGDYIAHGEYSVFQPISELSLDTSFFKSDQLFLKFNPTLANRYYVITPHKSYRINGAPKNDTNAHVFVDMCNTYGKPEGFNSYEVIGYTDGVQSTKVYRDSVYCRHPHSSSNFEVNSLMNQFIISWKDTSKTVEAFTVIQTYNDSLIQKYTIPSKPADSLYSLKTNIFYDTNAYKFELEKKWSNGYVYKRGSEETRKNNQIGIDGPAPILKPVRLNKGEEFLDGAPESSTNTPRFLVNKSSYNKEPFYHYVFVIDSKRPLSKKDVMIKVGDRVLHPNYVNSKTGACIFYPRSVGGDTTDISIYIRNKDGKIILNPYTHRTLLHWYYVPDPYNRKIKGNKLIWDPLKADALKGWEITNRGNVIAFVSKDKNSWEIPEDLQKSGSIFNVITVDVNDRRSEPLRPIPWQ
jgi:hypothetical protein